MMRTVRILGWDFEHVGEPEYAMQLIPLDPKCPFLALTHWQIPFDPKRRFCVFEDADLFISRYRFKPDFDSDDWSDVYLGVLDHYKEQSYFLLILLDRA